MYLGLYLIKLDSVTNIRGWMFLRGTGCNTPYIFWTYLSTLTFMELFKLGIVGVLPTKNDWAEIWHMFMDLIEAQIK